MGPQEIGCSYMADAFLTFGCVRGTDTLHTADNYFTTLTSVTESSSDVHNPNFDGNAKAEQQLYTEYTDMPEPPFDMDSLMRSPEGPTGIEVHQTSYAWSDEARKRSLLVDYWIKNVSNHPIQKGVIGIVVDGPICPRQGSTRDQDNICGLLMTVPSLLSRYADTLNLAWIADNGSELHLPGSFVGRAPLGLGVRILRAPKGGRFGFNWWADLLRTVGFAVWQTYFRWGPYGAARHGSAENSHDWYRTMINGQIDYDQAYGAQDFSAQGWAPPPANRDTLVDIANGADTKMLLSYGPLDDILPGDSVEFTVAFSIGAAFHRDSANFTTRFNPDHPEAYLNHLDFSDMIANARAIQWAFDTPGLDSDPNDGIDYRGRAHVMDCGQDSTASGASGCDSVFYEGDGIADFGTPLPPPAPAFSVTTKPGQVILRWDGSRSETARHSITGRRDFEGYRIYAGRDTASAKLSLVASWDRLDYARFVYDTSAPNNWRQVSYPYTLREWQIILGGVPDPRDYSAATLQRAYRDVYFDTVRNYMGEVVEVSARERFSCWLPQAANRADEYLGDAGMETNIIQQVATRDTTLDGYQFSYGVYEATIDNLSPSLPLYFAVTAFEQGDYVAKLPPLESSPGSNCKYGQPVYSANVVADSGIHVSVYPNPYKTIFNDAYGHATTYYAQGYEGKPGTQFTEYDRRIHFINLPDTAVITIYSLAGDLIRTIYHPDKHLSTYSSVADWDLVTRSAEAVMSGIYIYRIESRLGSQVGKIVIIK